MVVHRVGGLDVHDSVDFARHCPGFALVARKQRTLPVAGLGRLAVLGVRVTTVQELLLTSAGRAEDGRFENSWHVKKRKYN